jgi:hypothetical protein
VHEWSNEDFGSMDLVPMLAIAGGVAHPTTLLGLIACVPAKYKHATRTRITKDIIYRQPDEKKTQQLSGEMGAVCDSVSRQHKMLGSVAGHSKSPGSREKNCDDDIDEPSVFNRRIGR